MADDVKIELDTNLMAKLHTLPEVIAYTQDVADTVAQRARDLAPVDSGSYRDGITVDKPSPQKGVARVKATDPKSSWIEFGNANQQPQFTLRSAVESLGFKFKKGK